MKRHYLIGLHGLAGSGKNTVANIMWDKCGVFETAFADRLKDVVATMFGWDRLKLEDRDFKEAVDPKFGVSPRQALQRVGQTMKGQFGRYIWVDFWHQVYNELKDAHDVVVSDVRFDGEPNGTQPDEAQYIRDLGGVIIHIRRDNLDQVGDKGEVSEKGILVKEGDFVIDNNGTLEELEASVVGILRAMGMVK